MTRAGSFLLYSFLLPTFCCGRVTLHGTGTDAAAVDAVPTDAQTDEPEPDALPVIAPPDALVPDAAVLDAQCNHVLDLRRDEEILMPYTLTFPHGRVVGSNRLYLTSLGARIFAGFASDYIEGGAEPESMRVEFDMPVSRVVYTLTGGFIADGSVGHQYETDLGLIRSVYGEGNESIPVEHDGVTWLEIRGREGSTDGVRIGDIAYSTCGQ